MAGAFSRLIPALVAKLTQYYHASIISCYILWRWIRTGGAALRIKERQMPRKLIDGYNHKFITLPSGVKMHYVEAGDSTSPLMVLVHGYPEFWYSWRFQIDHFKDRFRVVAIDQRGYNESSKPPNISDYSTPLLAKDIDDLIHGLGYDSAVVVGHDWGGAVAWAHALLYPESVSRLVICNCPHPAAFGTLLQTSKQQRSASWYMFFYQTPLIPETAVAADDFNFFERAFWGKKGGLRNRENFTSEDMEAWKYTFSQPDSLRGPLNFYRCAFQFPSRDRQITKCTVKTLIIWGEEDCFLLKEGALLSKQWCEDATLHFIPGASHWVQQDDPTSVNHHMDNFL